MRGVSQLPEALNSYKSNFALIGISLHELDQWKALEKRL